MLDINNFIKNMPHSELEKYKVDHLFLLIGENTLPNYVAAHLLLKESGTPYLVHTTGTVDLAGQLKNILKGDLSRCLAAQLISLGEHESDAFHIHDKIGKVAKKLQDRLGLHYTGGTKAMAVHAYQALLGLNRPDTVFSYLDPRRLEICIDREDSDRIRCLAHIDVSLKKLFQLHGLAYKSPPTSIPEQPEAAVKFAEFHTDKQAATVWRTWCDRVLRKATRNDRDRLLSESQLKNVPQLSTESLQPHENIMQALMSLDILNDELSIQSIQKKGFGKLENVCEWLDGQWLEHHVLQQVRSVSQESATSFWIQDPGNPKENKFEFDVAFMKGYQLFAISCTTIDFKGGCKQKLFEAYLRARQLGGAEARVALVCCYDNPEVLRSELVLTTEDPKIAVFGREDLMNLSEKIQEWVTKQGGNT